MNYYLFLLSFMFLYMLFVYIHYKTRLHYVYIIGFVLVVSIISSSRVYFYTTSDDLIRYYNTYLLAKNIDLTDYLVLVPREVLFTSFNWFIYQIVGDITPRIYMFIFSFISSLLFSCAITRIFSISRITLIAIFCTLITPSFLTMETQLIRQMIAFNLLLLSISFYGKKRYFIFMVSFLFHKITAVFIVFIFISNILSKYKKVRIKRLLLVLFCSLIFSLLFKSVLYSIIPYLSIIPIVGSKAVYLRGLDFSNYSIGSVALFSIFSFVFVMICINKYKEKISKSELLFLYLCFCLLVVSFLSITISSLAVRFMPYFIFLYPLYILLLIRFYFTSKNLVIYLLIVITFFIFVMNSINSSNVAMALFNGSLL